MDVDRLPVLRDGAGCNVVEVTEPVRPALGLGRLYHESVLEGNLDVQDLHQIN